MSVEVTPAASRAAAATLARIVQPFTQPDSKRSIWQIVNTLVPYFALWAIMIVMVEQGLPYWSVLAVSVIAAGFYVRVFILFHDCCHGSFFGAPQANRFVGYVTGILTFTPFEQWRRSHAMHHDTVGDLDRRGVGDIWTLTAEEFEAAPRWKRVAYRIVRNPFFVLTFGTIIIFLIAFAGPAVCRVGGSLPGKKDMMDLIKMFLRQKYHGDAGWTVGGTGAGGGGRDRQCGRGASARSDRRRRPRGR